jgi:hypothetical protein
MKPSAPKQECVNVYNLCQAGGRVFAKEYQFPTTNLNRKWVTSQVRDSEDIDKALQMVAEFNAHLKSTGDKYYTVGKAAKDAMKGKAVITAFFGKPIEFPSGDELPDETLEEAEAIIIAKYGNPRNTHADEDASDNESDSEDGGDLGKDLGLDSDSSGDAEDAVDNSLTAHAERRAQMQAVRQALFESVCEPDMPSSSAVQHCPVDEVTATQAECNAEYNAAVDVLLADLHQVLGASATVADSAPSHLANKTVTLASFDYSNQSWRVVCGDTDALVHMLNITVVAASESAEPDMPSRIAVQNCPADEVTAAQSECTAEYSAAVDVLLADLHQVLGASATVADNALADKIVTLASFDYSNQSWRVVCGDTDALVHMSNITVIAAPESADIGGAASPTYDMDSLEHALAAVIDSEAAAGVVDPTADDAPAAAADADTAVAIPGSDQPETGWGSGGEVLRTKKCAKWLDLHEVQKNWVAMHAEKTMGRPLQPKEQPTAAQLREIFDAGVREGALPAGLPFEELRHIAKTWRVSQVQVSDALSVDID